ncbi:MAG: AtpZ/AtpI family protein [Phycisphaerales bacterium]|nr:MAG: AtpZ/AtpI family protein [Phycisphaerales bacterium]
MSERERFEDRDVQPDDLAGDQPGERWPSVPDPADTPEEDPRLKIPEVLTRPTPAPMATGESKGSWADAAKAWGAAFDFVGTVLGGVVVGYLVDRWAKTSPWGVMIGLGAGFVMAFVRIVRASIREDRKATEERRRNRGDGGGGKW